MGFYGAHHKTGDRKAGPEERIQVLGFTPSVEIS